ncbi:AbrB/MazE/SpoVT family DNA-binding domain-containing protein [Paenibacillus alvei]|uniref:AbrB/MazE/SpoVT family DNA-binding domain-containing protein n=1 Tax=Paenibacillus alvei TaxID=44250 RepID=A0ABT4H4L1_PAEAL|nr:AbrB/MazE/SpoVT family DNA-binding domain-containing protein [Paenibacillus alvei]MCY7485416.1 AbrB/MazE/SpoVT family DNA-binding domain-containing protein [Paenibacillus alvei]MCY9763928.1 AbrB/MazE/SpoVT family DNA-binding domain-containing protein [Paenibacillus alvei]MCY9771358.1 AbrB/MazE/SpoVT family DNA-binding domain-containing protein [Paenibacillus alvei]
MTKLSGFVRNVDALGRLVIPSEIRETLHIDKGVPLSITSDGVSITIRKHVLSCTFCEGLEHLESFMDKKVCRKCKDKLMGGCE